MCDGELIYNNIHILFSLQKFKQRAHLPENFCSMFTHVFIATIMKNNLIIFIICRQENSRPDFKVLIIVFAYKNCSLKHRGLVKWGVSDSGSRHSAYTEASIPYHSLLEASNKIVFQLHLRLHICDSACRQAMLFHQKRKFLR